MGCGQEWDIPGLLDVDRHLTHEPDLFTIGLTVHPSGARVKGAKLDKSILRY